MIKKLSYRISRVFLLTFVKIRKIRTSTCFFKRFVLLLLSEKPNRRRYFLVWLKFCSITRKGEYKP